MLMLHMKIDGEYKSIEIQEHELKSLIATGKFVKLGGEYYHIDHISKFNHKPKREDVPIVTKPVPPQILFKKGWFDD